MTETKITRPGVRRRQVVPVNEDRVLRLGVQVELVQRLAVRMLQLVAIALALATALVPLAKVLPDDADDPIQRSAFTGLVGLITEKESRFIGSDDESAADSVHPIAVPGGLLVTRVGLALLVAAGISTAISAVVLITSARRRDKIIVRVGAAVLFFAALLIAVGLGWLPTYGEDEIGPAWGLWIPLLAAVWVLVGHASTSQLEE